MQSKTKQLVFLGGGHSHALVIEQLGIKPITGVEVTLISEQKLTPYSGMLPGFVAGHYSYSDAHINLEKLCQWANVRFIQNRVTSIDAQTNTITVDSSESTHYDFLSVDIGSTPDLSVPGAKEHAVGVKPVSHFGATWNELLHSSSDGGDWGVVGAGAGGVELILAMAHRLKQNNKLKFHLFFPGPRILSGYPANVVTIVENALQSNNVTLHPNFHVSNVTEDGVVSKDDQHVSLTKSIWCTGASAATWLKQTGLKTSEKGFISVNAHLQSVSHDNVFAAGDCADMLFDPRPKAGVYAVRQAPYLTHNLRAVCSGNKEALKPIDLQTEFLSLLSLGRKSAVGCRNGLTFKGHWVWSLKNHIDQKFMRRLDKG